MASLGDRISVIIDVSTEKALGGLRQFKTAVSEADGFTGKLKAGLGSLKSSFLTGAGATAAMTAGIGIAAKVTADAVSAYADLGVQVGNFAEATGLATEDASRWIEVAGDLGVSAESLQSVFGKLEKSISPKLFDDLGVAIARTSQGNVDANQTFLNVLDRLREIEDPAQRAQTAAKLLGKGWQDVAPLIGQSADDIKSRLADVADVKVFDSRKVEQSKQFRDSFNDLKDAGEEFALTLGETVIPEVTALAKAAIFVVRQLKDMKDALTPNKGAEGMVKQQQQINDLYKEYGSVLFDTKAAQDAGIKSFEDLKSETAFASDESRKLIAAIEDQAAAFVSANAELAAHASNSDNSARLAAALTTQVRLNKEEVDKANTAYVRFHERATNARNALKQLQDQIAGRADFVHLQQTLSANAKTIKQLETDFHDNKITAEEYYNGVASAALDSKAAVADYVAEVDSIPEDKKLDLVAKLDPASPGALVGEIQRNLDNAKFYANVVGRVTISPSTKKEMEGGIDTPKPTTTTTTTWKTDTREPGKTGVSTYESVGTGLSRNTPVPVTINVNVPPGANLVDIGRVTADALAAFYRAGGERP